ncbi:MAG: peptidase T [Bacteroidetes bacterium]|nr:MAG: peptidase T [Bacteroidota bacterium]
MTVQEALACGLGEQLTERFFRYVAIPSQSDAAAAEVPSSEGQWQLAQLLQSELLNAGCEDVHLSEHCVLTARIASNSQRDLPAVGLCAHLDTVDIGLSPEVHPRIVHHTGGDICLNSKAGIYIREDEHPEIRHYIGEDLIVSDGTSVLGADDKASLASIMTVVALLHQGLELEHGDIYIAFVPDEEIGLRGVKMLDLTRFPVNFAYTLDCCEIGELVYETFNAASVDISIKGVSAHPMAAKGVLVNASLIAVDLANQLDRLQTPENTEGREGYTWLYSIEATPAQAALSLDIRDHDLQGYQEKKQYIAEAVALMQKRYPRAQISLRIDDIYGNIRDALNEQNRHCVDHLYEAMERLHIEAQTLAMRGGTDGSYLSTQGIPTPNFFTGAHNFHSHCEFLPIPSFEKSCATLLTLLEVIAEHG